MVALCVATADVGESNDFSPGCIIFAARDSLGVPRRELLRHGSSRLHANPVQVFMRPVLLHAAEAGTRTRVKLLPAYVEVWQERECVARHERSFSRYEQVLDLEHYLDVLERKPGALAGSSPLKQWRERGRWPESFDRLWQSLRERHGPQAGTRAMIALLGLGKRYGWDRLREAIKESLALGCTDAAAVRHLVTANELVRSHTEPFELSGLERYDRPLPQMQEYDLLLSLTTTGAEVAR